MGQKPEQRYELRSRSASEEESGNNEEWPAREGTIDYACQINQMFVADRTATENMEELMQCNILAVGMQYQVIGK